MTFLRLSLLLFFWCNTSFSDPSYDQALREISDGPEVQGSSSCENGSTSEENEQKYQILPEDESESIISKLLHVEPYELDRNGLKTNSRIFITVDIPAYNGNPAEQIRTKSDPYDLNSFFEATGRDIYDYPRMEDLEEEVIYHATPSHGRVNPVTRKKVEESISIMRYTNFVKIGNFSSADSFLQNTFQGKSVEEKLSFLGSLLKKLNDNYSRASMGQGVGAKDIPVRDLAKAIFVNNDGIGSETELKMGVCRHIHQFAVRAARQMGLKLSFGVTYPTSTGYHATMVVSDPNNPGRTYKLNYEGMKRDDRTRGHSVLEQDEGKLSSNGITFHMWGEDDQPVYFVPSERGVVLAQIAGEDLNNFDPNIRSTAKTVIAGIRLGSHLIKVFHSKTSAGEGEGITGVGVTRTINYNDFITGNYGLVGYGTQKTNRTGSLSARSSLIHETSTTGLYFYIDHQFNVNLVESDDFNLKIFSRFSLRGTGFFSNYRVASGSSSVTSDSRFLADGSAQLISGFEARTGRHLTLTGISDISGQVTDITQQGGGLNIYARRFSLFSDYETFVTPGVRLSTTSRLNLIPLEGNNILVGSSDISLSSTQRDKQIVLGVLYPISKIVPAYIPGSRTTIEATLRASFAQGMLGFSLSAYIVPGQEFQTARERKLEETQMRTDDFTPQDSETIPTDVHSIETEVGVGITGEFRF